MSYRKRHQNGPGKRPGPASNKKNRTISIL
jgi:hypothetical protein